MESNPTFVPEPANASTQTRQCEERLTRALHASDFVAAEALSESLGSAIVTELRAAPPATREALCRERLAALSDQLNLARVLRSHLAGQLQLNSAVWAYQSPSTEGHSWGIDA